MARRELITVQAVETAYGKGDKALPVPYGAIVTPLARDVARRLSVLLTPVRTSRRGCAYANWKANGTARQAVDRACAIAAAASAQGEGGQTREVVIFPPFPHLPLVAAALEGSPVRLGAQDLSEHAPGATTGAVPATMLLDLGVTHVLIGHSERRNLLGDDRPRVQRKLRVALDAGLTPVLCVGETLEEREAARTHSVLRSQLLHALETLRASEASSLVLAYEPVWAIGTGLTPTRTEITACLTALRDHLARRFDDGLAERTRILYGGSVNDKNAARIFALPSCDGGLVGGASLKPERFGAIIAAE
ncbi:MAG: triose-phosphate isomerase [Planctomycetota bacterium]